MTTPRKIITCVTCSKSAPNAGRTMCRACYQRDYKWRNLKKANPGTMERPPLPGRYKKCDCGQAATVTVFLKFGDCIEGAKGGDTFHLCDRCAALEREQRRETD